jgi:DNA polymerase elongation subunit (family B)
MIKKQIRARLKPEEYDIILAHRKGQKLLDKQIIATLVNKGDTETANQYGITKDRLEKIKEKERFDKKKYPKILVLDIETLPMSVRTFGLYKQRIPHYNIIKNKDIVVLSWVAKWLYDSEVMSDILTPDEAIRHDDKRIMQGMWNLLEQATVVIAHNAKNFDIRVINSRFLVNGILPPTPYQVIDTLTESQKLFRTSSHKLDYLGKLLFNKGKKNTDFSLWERCDEGDQRSLDYMLEYNKEDVLLLEECYLEMRPYFTAHPNLNVHSHSDETACPYCESTNLKETDSYYNTMAGTFLVIRCGDCGGISRRRLSDLNRKQRNNLIIPTAR